MFDSFTKSLSFNPLAPLEDAYNIFNSERNFRLQKENLSYQKDLQNKIFEREDSSLQRRVADAEAAGLNPQLALGSGASAGQAISTSAPQHDPMKLDFVEKAINLKKSLAELDLLNNENEGKKKQNVLLDLQKLIDEHNFKYYADNNLPTNANGQYVQMLQAVGAILKGLKGDNSSIVGEIKEDVNNVRDKAHKIANPQESNPEFEEVREYAKNRVKQDYNQAVDFATSVERKIKNVYDKYIKRKK